jgi:hypothetical protein
LLEALEEISDAEIQRLLRLRQDRNRCMVEIKRAQR